MRFTPDGGAIDISLNPTGAGVEVSVRDRGPGIAPEHLPRIFDRLYRADPSRSAQGSGLGLAIVKSIMDLHGGSAIAQSEVGRGTLVTLAFPNRATQE